MKWTTKKPKFTEECLLIVATEIQENWDFAIFQILKTDFEDMWYWGVFDGDGCEWGDIEDLQADKYLVMPLLKNKK